MHPLREWLTHPSPDAGVYLADPADGWQLQSYPELAAAARRVAAALAAEGVRPGDTVCVLMPTGYPALSAIFGVWAAGATVCPVVPPSFQPADEYVRHVAAIVEQAAPRLTISSAEFLPLIGAALDLSGQPGLPWVLREGGGGTPAPAAGRTGAAAVHLRLYRTPTRSAGVMGQPGRQPRHAEPVERVAAWRRHRVVAAAPPRHGTDRLSPVLRREPGRPVVDAS